MAAIVTSVRRRYRHRFLHAITTSRMRLPSATARIT